MFLDEVEIEVWAGDGGHGCVSFRREKYVPRGGPDGGDGGDGGDVVLEATRDRNTLHHLAHTPVLKAGSGAPGQGKNRHGKNGADRSIFVPLGTVVRDVQTGEVIGDLASPGMHEVVARGGGGGRGNKYFATATHQVPREAEEGEPGDRRRLHLELKLIADVGLVGLPNAGKSTLLSRVSAARPKIASYPFTTLEPQLGIVVLGEDRRLVFADIPGLIEGAHEGHGLGDRFLRHIERTRLLLHLVDVSSLADSPPAAAYRTLRQELIRYSPTLARKPEVVVASKVDISQEPERLLELEEELGYRPLPLSSVRGDGIERLLATVHQRLEEAQEEGGGDPVGSNEGSDVE